MGILVQVTDEAGALNELCAIWVQQAIVYDSLIPYKVNTDPRRQLVPKSGISSIFVIASSLFHTPPTNDIDLELFGVAVDLFHGVITERVVAKIEVFLVLLV